MFLPPKHILPLLLTTVITLTTASPEQKPAYRIISPAASAILTPNTPSVIAWSTTQRTSAKLSLHLETTTNHTNLYTIATNITNSGSISWSPPARIPPGEGYIIVLDPTTSPDNNTTTSPSTSNPTPEEKETYKSPAFTITAPKPTPNNSTSTTNATNSTTAEQTTYYPTDNQAIGRGTTTIVTWPVAPDQKSGHVSVYLMEGWGETAKTRNVSTVATHVANSGSLACVLPGNLTLAADYRFAVVGAQGGEDVRYSAMFRVVDGDDDESSDGSGDGEGDDEVKDVQEKNEEDEGGEDGEVHAAETGATSTESGLASGSTGVLKSDSTWIATAGGSRVMSSGGWVALGMALVSLLV